MGRTLFIQISDFGSIASENKWAPREETFFKYWCKENGQYPIYYLIEQNHIDYTLLCQDDKTSIIEDIQNIKTQEMKKIKLETSQDDSKESSLRESESKFDNLIESVKVLESTETDNFEILKQKKNICDQLEIESSLEHSKLKDLIKTSKKEIMEYDSKIKNTEMQNIGNTIKNTKLLTSDDNSEVNEKLKQNICEMNKKVIDKHNINNSQMYKIVQGELNKQVGINTEDQILKKLENKSKEEIHSKNTRMKYKNIFENDKYTYKIGGKTDGIQEDTIIEIKNRRSKYNIKKNKYELYQLLGYMYIHEKSYGKIVQNIDGIVFDSDTETAREWGVIDINDKKWKTLWKDFLQNLKSFFDDIVETDDIYIPKNLSKPFCKMNTDFSFEYLGNTSFDKDIFNIISKI